MKSESIAPLYARVLAFAEKFAISRNNAWELIRVRDDGTSHIRAIKHGKIVLVDLQSAEDYFASLPRYQGATEKTPAACAGRRARRVRSNG
jgi:hypothetical protein